MPTKKSKSASSKKKSVLLVLGVITLLFVGYFGIRTYVHHQQTEKTFQQDKIRFAQTEKNMADAYNAVVESVGKPYETKISKVCGYGALKFQRGPLNCGIGYSLIYGVNDVASGRSLTAAVFADYNGKHGFTQAHNTIPYNIDDTQQSFTAYISDRQGLSCDFYYVLWSTEDFNKIVVPAQGYKDNDTDYKNTAVYNFVCNRDVPKALYSIDKSTE